MAKGQENEGGKDMLSLVNYCFSLIVEKKPENGEDSETHSINRDSAFFGVFDGCGGAGSQPCPKFYGKTEAFIASRATAFAFSDWFEGSNIQTGWDADSLKDRVVKYLSTSNERVGEKSLLVGGIKKKFPTTAAAGICYPGKASIEIDYYWAGDSRVYMFTPQGLAQLTEDDLGGIDAMENLTNDGVLTNVVNLSKDFTIHTGHVSMDRPGIVFAATDGCFGYFSTPMEFEYLLLQTMLNSDCPSSDQSGVSKDWLEKHGNKPQCGWQEKLKEEIGKVAGDDYTISGYAIGFSSFEDMKKAFAKRASFVFNEYISGLKDKDYEEKLALWQKYKDHYYRFLCRP